MTTRSFNGKQYQEYDFTNSKKNAKIICDGLRNNGFLARAVKTVNGYVIYARKEKK